MAFMNSWPFLSHAIGISMAACAQQLLVVSVCAWHNLGETGGVIGTHQVTTKGGRSFSGLLVVLPLEAGAVEQQLAPDFGAICFALYDIYFVQVVDARFTAGHRALPLQ